MAQTVVSITPTSASFIAMSGDAGAVVTTFVATLSPPTPPFGGPWSLSGPDAGLFVIDRLTGVCSVGAADVAVGSYRVTVNVGIAVVPATLRLDVFPPAPSIPSTTPLGATVATLQGVWSDGSAFTGSYMFVSPNYDDDTYSISGSNLIVASNGPGVGAAGGAIERVTMEAIQMSPTADGVTSSAPSGAPLKNSAGVCSWGPAQSGRLIGGGIFVGDNVLYLNGRQVFSAFLIEVANGGQLYAHNSISGWFVWNGTQFVASAAP